MHYLITGGAGFIGSHLVDALLAEPGTRVRVIDNFSSGRRAHLARHDADSRLEIVETDLLHLDTILGAFSGVDVVFHLAANPDARWGIDNTRLDLDQETVVTYNVLESMRRSGAQRIVFSSSGTVYGDIGTKVAIESLGPCLPVSLYGAGKLASEGLISGFCGTFGLSATILRFGNIVGERTTHGVIFDFIRKLADDPSVLSVLGDGNQAKPYVYVGDLIAGLRFASALVSKYEAGTFDVFNISPDGGTSVRFIANNLLDALGLGGICRPVFGTTERGWAGDVPQSRMSARKLGDAGFRLPRSSDEAVHHAIERIVAWIASAPQEAVGLRLPDRPAAPRA